MKCRIRGKKGIIELKNDDYKPGGEAKAFIHNGSVFKIYHDKNQMIPDSKVLELGEITTPNVFKPIDIVIDDHDKPIGFTMDIATGEPFVKFYPDKYRKGFNIANDDIIELLTRIQTAISDIHRQHILLVDINDMNIIVDPSDLIPKFIDVNSWQTRSFPATAINPNIKDHTAKKFTELTDWYSYAIIACYQLLGIHPFRGSHPDYKKSQTIDRMKDGISIFNPDTNVPKSVRDFSVIPVNLKEWFIQLFEKGQRTPPPTSPGMITTLPVKIYTFKGSDNFEIAHVKKYKNDILFQSLIFNRNIVRTTKHILIGNESYRVSPGVKLLLLPASETPILAKIDDGYLGLKTVLSNKQIDVPKIKCDDIMVSDNSLYVINGDKLMKIDFTEINDIQVMVSVKNKIKISEFARNIFNTALIQQILGKPHIVIPLENNFRNIFIAELEGYKIIDAKYSNGIAMIIGRKDSKYTRFILRFDDNVQKYHMRTIDDIDTPVINFISLDNGIVISINEDSSLEIFYRRIDKPDVKVIKDPNIDPGMKLCHSGMMVRFFKDEGMYSLKMK